MGSTPPGIKRRRILLPVALLALATGCSTYSDGSMADHESMPHAHGAGGAVHTPGAHAHSARGDGLSASLDGYSLDGLRIAGRGNRSHLSFRILGPSGAPQLQFSLDQARLLHLYVVSADLATYHHAHPVIDSTGTWQVDLPVLRPGTQHVVVSFVAIAPDSSEQALVLGSDLPVGGTATLRRLPPERTTATVDGYQVRLGGDLLLAQPAGLQVEVTRRGRPADLVPYLDTWVHLSAVNLESGAFVHAHPDTSATADADAPRRVSLSATAPAPGRYRVFVEFATASGVHRVAFTRSAWG